MSDKRDKELQERINEIEEAVRPGMKSKQCLLDEINSLRHVISQALGRIEELLYHFQLTDQDFEVFDGNCCAICVYLEGLQEKVSKGEMIDES